MIRLLFLLLGLLDRRAPTPPTAHSVPFAPPPAPQANPQANPLALAAARQERDHHLDEAVGYLQAGELAWAEMACRAATWVHVAVRLQ